MSDIEIIQLIQRRQHHQAISKLYGEFPKMRRLVRQKGGNSNDAQDVFQEAIVIFCRKAADPAFQLTSSIGTYLYSVCRHVWKDMQRKQKRQVLLDDMTDVGNELAETVQEHLEREEKYGYLDRVLQQIDERCRQIFRLYYFEKQSMLQIAQQVGFSGEESAKTQKYKCVEQARKLAQKFLLVHQK
jgi:RNA polymerase sigma factor (sigma-70 family)